MSEPLTLTIEQSRRFEPGDYLQVEVDSEVLNERFEIWASERRTMGWGHSAFGAGRLGYGRSLGFGIGAMGRGIFGQGARLLTITTKQAFVAGIYAIRLRVVDAKGNPGNWSASTDITHAPPPLPPYNLRISGTNLAFNWVP